MIVHHADDLDAKLQMIVCAFEAEATNGDLTSKRNPMNQQFYRGAKKD
jgi:3'-5' exoribonuclease